MSTSLFKGVQLFQGLAEPELAELATICSDRVAAPGELIIEQNTTGSELYVIADGSVEVFIRGLSSPSSLVVLGQGQVFGELALIDQGYRSASVKATRDGARLAVLESHQFNELCQRNTHIGFVVMRNLAVDIAFKLRHRNLTEL